MAGFKDCIRSAQEQGAISKEEADELIRRYEAHAATLRAAGAPDPNAAAKNALAASLDAEAARAKMLAQMGAEKRGAIAEHLHAYRGPDGKPDVYEASMRLLEHYGFSGTSSVVGRMRSIVALAHGELADVLRTFERNFYTGLRHQQVAARDLVHELLGTPTGRPEIKAMADGVAAQFERLRERFNAAGGDIGKIEGGYIPQLHNAVALMKSGFEKWREDIRPRLEPAKMRDPLTGEAMTPARLDESLRPVYDAITTEGWATREPSTTPLTRGALANQRQEHRFLAFKSAEDWLWYDQHYGHGDPMKAIFGHINGMARDIAAAETLGPNPTASVEYLKQVVLSEHGKLVAGKDSLFQPSGLSTKGLKDAGADAAKKIDDLWYFVRGRETVKQGVADFYGNVRNVLTAAQLGSAVVTAAVTDPGIEAMARRQLGMSQAALFGSNAKVYADTVSRYFEQLPVLKTVSHVIDQFTGAPREQALRAGMIMDEFLHVMGDEARYAGSLGGNVWSRWLADRTITLTGLGPITEARKAVFQLELQGFVADHAGAAFDALPAPLRDKMAGYGFDAAQWDTLRAAARGRDGFLRPVDVVAADRGLAERYVEMINGETERAVPSGTLRSRAFVIGSRPKGQHLAELWEGAWQYKSFGLSMMTLQAEAIAQETARGGKAAGATYAAQLLVLTTLGGALAMQLKHLASGRDPQDMADPKFFAAAMATGGGLGLMGDFMFADVNRYGYSFQEQALGPTGALVTDIAKFTAGNMMEAIQGLNDPRKSTNIGHEAVQLAGKYTPFAASAWYTRLAFRRELIDQLDYMADPRAHTRWREEERRAQRERGQGYFWPPGETAPTRAPDLSTAGGR